MARFDDLPRVSGALTPLEKLRVAFDLSDAAIVLVRARLRREHPDATDSEIDRLLESWLATRPGAQHGDGDGRMVTWPRTRRQ